MFRSMFLGFFLVNGTLKRDICCYCVCNGNKSHKFLFLRSVLKMIKKRSKNIIYLLYYLGKIGCELNSQHC
jgi:hypothetical protein